MTSPDPTARSWWGWGHTSEQIAGDALRGLGSLLADRFARSPADIADPVDPAAIPLPAPRVALPASLAELGSGDGTDRLRHGHGASFREVVRALHGDVPNVPDLVVRPRTATDVARLLEWCSEGGVACLPWGGGTSVVGGVTPVAEPCVSLDLERLDRVLEVDEVSRTARIQAGALGPVIEEQLRRRGLTLRHFPQSWAFSTLGGWIATRAAGHYATGPTHIDDLVASITAETPIGTWSSRRLPGSGAGPSPDRMLLGSEGTLGVVTEAWVRLQTRPRSRARATVAFPTFAAGLAAVRSIVQDGLQPANCRLLDPTEAALAGAGPPDGTRTLLVLGFEASEASLRAPMDRAMELLRDHAAEVVDVPSFVDGDRTDTAGGSAAAWRSSFLRGPYLRDALARLGAVAETFETAVTWDRATEVVATLRETAETAAAAACGSASVAVRTTHAYPDGVAPYLTVVAPGPAEGLDGVARARAQAAAWDEVKIAVSEAIDAAGATITHHHGVGRDHRRWYDRQRPEPFATALGAAKRALDPAGVLNPGILFDQAPPPAARSGTGHPSP